MRLQGAALCLVLASVAACSGTRVVAPLSCSLTIGARSRTVSMVSRKDSTALADVSGYSARFTVIDAKGNAGHLRVELHGPGLEPGSVASGGFDSSQPGSFAGRARTPHGDLMYACNARGLA